VLDDIAVGPFAEQPAGKIAAPLAVGTAAHVQLHEGAGFLHILPGGRGLACLQADDGVADAQRLAGLHRQVAGQAVALVEQADHGGALGHRRAGQAGLVRVADRLALDLYRAALIRFWRIIATAGRQQRAPQKRRAKQDRRESPRRTPNHAASGLHAS